MFIYMKHMKADLSQRKRERERFTRRAFERLADTQQRSSILPILATKPAEATAGHANSPVTPKQHHSQAVNPQTIKTESQTLTAVLRDLNLKRCSDLMGLSVCVCVRV